jgi:hypothetical protein
LFTSEDEEGIEPLPIWEDPIFYGVWGAVEGVIKGITVVFNNEAVTQITGFTKHGINQIINRGIKPAVLLDALKNPIKILEKVDEIGRSSFQYIGKEATIVLNKTKEIITGWLN